MNQKFNDVAGRQHASHFINKSRNDVETSIMVVVVVVIISRFAPHL